MVEKTLHDHDTWLLSRLIDPQTEDYEQISRLVIRQALVRFFQAVESMSKKRVFITDAWASEGHNPGSLHYKGRAADFVLLSPPLWREVKRDELDKIWKDMDTIARSENLVLINEYENPSNASTAGHIHVHMGDK